MTIVTDATSVEDLPLLHEKSFDRPLVAQAVSDQLRLLTLDAL